MEWGTTLPHQPCFVPGACYAVDPAGRGDAVIHHRGTENTENGYKRITNTYRASARIRQPRVHTMSRHDNHEYSVMRSVRLGITNPDRTSACIRQIRVHPCPVLSHDRINTSRAAHNLAHPVYTNADCYEHSDHSGKIR